MCSSKMQLITDHFKSSKFGENFVFFIITPRAISLMFSFGKWKNIEGE